MKKSFSFLFFSFFFLEIIFCGQMSFLFAFEVKILKRLWAYGIFEICAWKNVFESRGVLKILRKICAFPVTGNGVGVLDVDLKFF